MESNLPDRKVKRYERPIKRFIIAGSMATVAAVILLSWIGVNYFFPERVRESPVSLVRLKNMFSFVVLGKKPVLYYLDIEKSGKDYRLRRGDIFDVSYRDEFVIKDISTDAFFGRGISVNVEGYGAQDHFRVMLRGLDIVDKVLMARGKSMDKDAIDAGSIIVKYQDKVIASIPMRIIVTPQDWLRYAKSSENQIAQIEYLKKAIAMNKNDIGVRKMLAALYYQTGNLDKAISQYNSIIALKPNDASALMELMKCYINAKDNSKAIKTGTKLIRIDPKNASAFANIAYAYSNTGAWEKAIVNYKESLRLNPDDTEVRVKLGEAYEKAKDFKSAIEQYKHVSSKARESDRVMIALAGAYLKSGNYDDSIRLYREIIAKQPRNASAYSNLGLAYGGKL